MVKRLALFEKFLNWYWLRPESAIFSTLAADSCQKTLNLFGESKGTIDVSCGDGVFSFITFGGELAQSNDKFQSVDTSRPIRIGNQDVFDKYEETYSLDIVHKPKIFYEYGADLKANSISKSSHLESYQNLFIHDNNQPIPLPAESLHYIFSNSSYWVENFESHINDLTRLCASGGHIVLHMQTTVAHKYAAKNYLPQMGPKFHQIIDAGRSEVTKHFRSLDEILAIIEQIKSAQIVEVEPICGDIVGFIDDIGFRPLFQPLVGMANALPSQTKVKVKKQWCDIFFELFRHFIETYQVDKSSAFRYSIVLKKN